MTVRSSLPQARLVEVLGEEVHAIDPNLPISRVQGLQVYVDEVLANLRFKARRWAEGYD